MSPKTLLPIAAAVSAVVFNLTLVAPAQAQVKAALTRDVDRPSAQPVNGVCTVQAVPNGSSNAVKCKLYTVPAGKRLVVETISYQAVTTVGSPIFSIVFGQDPGDVYFLQPLFPNVYSVTPVFAYDQLGGRVYMATQALKMYLDEAQTLVAGGAYGSRDSYYWGFNFSGYLVDK